MNNSVLTATFTRLRSHLQAIASGILGNRQDAEDVLQESFCKLWRHRLEITDEISAARLSYTVVRHAAIDVVRHNRDRQSASIDDHDIPLADASSAEDDTAHLYSEIMSLCRRHLNERQWQIFKMHDIDNVSYPEIASRLGLSQENVRAILSRSRKLIREIYRKNNL